MRVLIFQHIAGEPPAAFAQHIAAAGDTAHIVRFFDDPTIPDLSGFDILIVMGGPMDVWEEQAHPWLGPEKQAIADWVQKDRGPYLGICLGHQLLAEVMGGICARMETPEIAVAPVTLYPNAHQDPVFASLPPKFPAVHWHGVEVAHLPPGATVLGGSAGCVNQAMRAGHRAWGCQFHPEIEPGTLTTWMQDDGNRQAAERWLGSARKAQAFVTKGEAQADGFGALSAKLYAGLRAQV